MTIKPGEPMLRSNFRFPPFAKPGRYLKLASLMVWIVSWLAIYRGVVLVWSANTINSPGLVIGSWGYIVIVPIVMIGTRLYPRPIQVPSITKSYIKSVGAAFTRYANCPAGQIIIG